MIRYIKRKNIDVKKYDYCIENSIQSRIYAFSWYLDIVADNWSVLVLNDYEAVMPLTWKSKLGLKYIVQPYFCQQLGIFSLSLINVNIQNDFLKKIPLIFLKVTQNLNSENFPNKNTFEKKNYILKLDDVYINLLKSYSKGRKHSVKTSFKNSLEIKKTTINNLVEIQKNFYSYKVFSKEILIELSNYTTKLNKCKVLGVFKEEKLLGGGLFLKSSKRIIYLFSSFNEDGRKYQAASFLIDSVIKENERSNFFLDFEGGNIPNIGSFFKSFGAEPENFYVYIKKPFHQFF